MAALGETIADLVAAHRADPATITATISRTYARIATAADPAMFISLLAEREALANAAEIAMGDRSRPLFGIPVAVKDNIDVVGFPTTAGCPAYAYTPQRDATVVARLRHAGAIVIGKTNLDQFATGLVGVRSPYGIPRNTMRADLVPGGSSSGSAVAVSRGIVPLSLGTDTAGSGRVPAGLNNIVGLKPTVGLIPTDGVVPACRSLDCVSILSLTVDDALAALSVLSASEVADQHQSAETAPIVGVLRPAQRTFFGDTGAERAYNLAIERALALGWHIQEIDFTAHFETSALLYDGPWVAERTAAVGAFLAAHASAVHPVTRRIIEGGHRFSAVDVFEAMARLAILRRRAVAAIAGVDAVMVPTMPSAYTCVEVAAEPLLLNARSGTYTNFVNLLDMAGIAVPSSILSDGRPAGVTFLGAAGRDSTLAAMAGRYHAATGLTLGALPATRAPEPTQQKASNNERVSIAVVGAHLRGMPLNGDLVALGARFVREAKTTPDYRLFALAGTSPPKPGLLRVADGGGSAITVEIWSLGVAEFGRFIAAIPPPLSIGSLRC